MNHKNRKAKKTGKARFGVSISQEANRLLEVLRRETGGNRSTTLEVLIRQGHRALKRDGIFMGKIGQDSHRRPLDN